MDQIQMNHIENALRATGSWCVDQCIEELRKLNVKTPDDIVFPASMGHMQLVARKAAQEVL